MAHRIARRDVLKATGGAFAAATLGTASIRQVRAQTNLRFAWWGSDERHQRTYEALDLFQELHPDIVVMPEISSSNEYRDKLAVQVSGGQAPDVIQMSGQYILEYADRGALLDLAAYVPDPIDLEGWDAATRELGVINGQMSGIPIGIDSYALIYDIDVLDGIGIAMPDDSMTWDDFAALTKEIATALGEGFYGTEDAGGQYEALETFVRQRGKTLFRTDGPGLGFDRDDLVEWLTYWDDLRKAGAAPPADVTSVGNNAPESVPLVVGQAPIEWTSASQFVNFGGLIDHELGLHLHPTGRPDAEFGQFIRPALFISAYSQTPAPEAAAVLINFLLNDVEAAKLLLSARGIPPAPEVRELVQSLVSDQERRAFEYVDLVAASSTQANILTPPGGAEVYDLLWSTNMSVAFGEQTVEEAADLFVTEAQSELE
jgi:multiple sugar transport system substrate-binding protein